MQKAAEQDKACRISQLSSLLQQSYNIIWKIVQDFSAY